MAEKEDKVVLEREYIVPLRREWSKVPDYRRTARALKALKQFIAKHMKVEERDTKKVKIDRYLNEELWIHGIRRPLIKVKVKAKKYDSGIVKVELAEIPQYLKFKIDKDKRAIERAGKSSEKKVKEEKKEEKTDEQKKNTEEKEKSTVEAGFKQSDNQAKELKHETRVQKVKKQPLKRMALQK